MYNIYQLEGKTALVTGGATGIGYAIAKEFVAAGAKVVIIGRREKALIEAQQSLGNMCHYIVHDITELSSHDGLVSKIEREIGAIDILVNNAGKHLKKPSIEITDEELQAVLMTHINGAFALTRSCLGGMLDRKSGSIIFISSMSAFYGLTYVTAYSTAKSGLFGMVRTLASEYSDQGVRFNAIAPGFIESAMFKKAMEADPERMRRVMDRTPMKRLGAPEDIGRAALFMASDASSFVTGVCLPVDGGNSIGF